MLSLNNGVTAEHSGGCLSSGVASYGVALLISAILLESLARRKRHLDRALIKRGKIE